MDLKIHSSHLHDFFFHIFTAITQEHRIGWIQDYQNFKRNRWKNAATMNCHTVGRKSMILNTEHILSIM